MFLIRSLWLLAAIIWLLAILLFLSPDTNARLRVHQFLVVEGRALESRVSGLGNSFQTLLMNVMNGDPAARMAALREALKRTNAVIKADAASIAGFFSATTPAATQITGTSLRPTPTTPLPESSDRKGANPTTAVWVRVDRSRIRAGPSTNHQILRRGVNAGTELVVVGRNAAGDWLRIEFENESGGILKGWIYTELTGITADDLAKLPVATPTVR